MWYGDVACHFPKNWKGTRPLGMVFGDKIHNFGLKF